VIRLVFSNLDLHSPVRFVAKYLRGAKRSLESRALLMQQNRAVLLALIPGPAGAFCLSRNERRDASTGSRPLLRLDLYLNGALPATSTLTSTHRLSQCVGRTSREREREREKRKRMCWRKERVERNIRLKGKKSFAKRKYLRDTWYVVAREIFRRCLKEKYYSRRKGLWVSRIRI